MKSISSFVRRVFGLRIPVTADGYLLEVVTVPAELDQIESIPIELQYVLSLKPSRVEAFRGFLEQGYGVGVRSVEKTPERILQAVEHISRLSQANTIIPWLEGLLRREEFPSFTLDEMERAAEKGVNLNEEVRVILSHRYEFTKIILVDLHNRCIGAAEQNMVQELNQELFPLAIESIIHRIVFDSAHTRTEVAQSILKALIIVGPIAHTLEHLVSGLGKVFAASVDDVLTEVAELFALRGSGFTWRQLARRSRILIPVFFLATYGAFHVETVIQQGHLAAAGALFGLSAVSLSLVTAIQSIGMYRQAFLSLVTQGKFRLAAGERLIWVALRQDFTNPARLGLFIGAVASPFVSAIVFTGWSSLVHNGWMLALLGSVESVIAGCAVIGAKRIERWRFHSKLKKRIARQHRVNGSGAARA